MAKEAGKDLTFLEHLDIFRKHLMRSAFAIVFFAVIAFIFKEFIFDNIIFAPREPWFPTNRFFCYLGKLLDMNSMCINQTKFTLMNVELGGQFSTHLMVSIISGVIISFPFILWQFWLFIKPALKENEIRYSRGVIYFASVLFFMGVLFGYYLIIPLTIEFFGSYYISGEVINQINISSFISSVTTVSLWSGIVFELPIVVYFLSKIGLITPSFLKKYRKHAIVVLFIIAAVITPPDVFSQLLVVGPLILLYEFSIIISKRVMKNKALKN
ncbi:MAG: twin arginine-targeting protein translocase TatC [Bacteroidetes bacterium GWA2_31_9]|nr:MAG: twin arginine-targeting protein translocase TatC [Bacteroidetes bacterium GWA2_31_9]